MRSNKTQYAILGCLSFKPMSAYDIKTMLQNSTNYFWSEGEGQLYPTLKMLLEKESVDFHEEAAQKSGIKKVYNITGKGQQELIAWLRSRGEKLTYRNERLLKLFFGFNIPNQENIQRLQAFKQSLLEELEIYLAIEKKFLSKPLDKHKKFWYASLLYGLEITRAEINWCDNTINLIGD